MGKAKKFKVSKGDIKLRLEDQLEEDKYAQARSKNRVKVRSRKDEDEEFVDAQLSRKILNQAHKQQRELEEEEGLQDPGTKPSTSSTVNLGDDSDDFKEEEDDLEGDNYCDKIVVTEEEELAMARFMSKDPLPRRTLADIIMEKITEKQTELQTQFSDAGTMQLQDLDPKVREMYIGVRDVLAKYRSGKLPKAFKIIPSLRNWEQILYLTDPTSWSAAAMYQATRIFASNLTERMTQRFYNLVLLPRVRDDISEYKRLNFHLYQALRKALFKPAAFMKGFLLPLCESGTCTLREAIIVGSVLARNSVPILHSAAAMLKLAEMEYTGASSIFLRVLLDKKYALPYRVLVFKYLLSKNLGNNPMYKFERETRELPVLWHQALLTFVQRYKSDISSEQRDALLKLLHHQNHYTITPEVRRELQNATCRDVETAEAMAT
ncbi:hypothetical protein B566_EDAN017306 [Ephemera danica]|nr:hypothetical protein B566_EDAN017306 [Ephemera danica]